MRKYYPLLTRDGDIQGAQWCVHFGARTRAKVEDERTNCMDADNLLETTIIKPRSMPRSPGTMPSPNSTMRTFTASRPLAWLDWHDDDERGRYSARFDQNRPVLHFVGFRGEDYAKGIGE